MTAADVTIAEGVRLRRLGFNCIPTLNSIGHCPKSYGRFRDEGMPASEFEALARRGAHGIQAALGVEWGFAVVDVDGELGAAVWSNWGVYLDCPSTVTSTSPTGGFHLWYAIPPGVDRLPKCDLWQGPGDHQGIELLADRCLARVWPSYKTVGGRKVPYRWLDGRGPGECPMAPLPAWIVRRAAAARPHVAAGVPPGFGLGPSVHGGGTAANLTRRATGGFASDWRTVRESVGDKLALASRWGLRVVGQPNPDGYVTCRAVGREDRHPSCRFNIHSGNYFDFVMSEFLNFFSLAIALKAYPDFISAVRGLEQACGLRRAS